MPKYVKKPIVIEAEQFFPDKPVEGVRKVPRRTVDATRTRGIIYDTPERYEIDTLEGTMVVEPGDWIIKGVVGERYPCKDAIFKLSYTPLEMVQDPPTARPLEDWEHLTDRN